jgi:hypothetical protein
LRLPHSEDRLGAERPTLEYSNISRSLRKTDAGTASIRRTGH